MQKHHFFTNKHTTKYTPEFERILDRYNLDLDKDWNKVTIPHEGRHTDYYNKMMLKELKEADRYARGDRTKLLKYLEDGIFKKIIRNPEIMYKEE